MVHATLKFIVKIIPIEGDMSQIKFLQQKLFPASRKLNGLASFKMAEKENQQSSLKVYLKLS